MATIHIIFCCLIGFYKYAMFNYIVQKKFIAKPGF